MRVGGRTTPRSDRLLRSGRHITMLPDDLTRSMLAALGKHVDLREDIEGDVAL